MTNRPPDTVQLEPGAIVRETARAIGVLILTGKPQSSKLIWLPRSQIQADGRVPIWLFASASRRHGAFRLHPDTAGPDAAAWLRFAGGKATVVTAKAASRLLGEMFTDYRRAFPPPPRTGICWQCGSHAILHMTPDGGTICAECLAARPHLHHHQKENHHETSAA